jgi:hypothetical protein
MALSVPSTENDRAKAAADRSSTKGIPMNLLPRFSRHTLPGGIVLATIVAATVSLGAPSLAGASSPTVVPAGGSFEQTPLLYTTSDTCGLLCSVSTTRQGESTNHYLHTTYESLLGVIGTSAGTATITSPQFTWSQATPSSLELALDRRSSLGALVGLNDSATFEVVLHNDTTATSTQISSEALSSAETTFQDYETAVTPSALSEGDTYQLAIKERFSALAGVIADATVDIDNVGLTVTPSPVPASIGSTTLSTPTEHSITASSTVDTYGEEATYAIEYGTTSSYGSETSLQTIPAGTESSQVSSTVGGLAPGTAYHARFVVSDAGGTTYGPDVVFTTASASPPTVSSAAIGGVTDGGAIASATVNPGANSTTVKVEYGTSKAYGQSTATQTIAAAAGASSVQIPLIGLSASTSYHARIVAVNADGTVDGEDLTFTTAAGSTGGAGAPAIGASSAIGVQERGATLQTSVDTGGEAGTYEVQYGTTISYETSTTGGSIAAGSSGSVPLSVPVSGLAPGTTYHARFVVGDGGGTSEGMDVVFTTAPSSPPAISSASVSEVSESSALVSTTVSPGANSTAVKVSYGTSTAYGQITSTQTVTAGGRASTVQIPLSGLAAETTYDAEVLASNADGTVESSNLKFTTPAGGTGAAGAGGEPASITASAVNDETDQSAIAHATIDTNGEAATYEVQYGTSTGYGSATSTQSLPAASSGTPVSVALVGLQAGQTYHARVRVVSASGTSYGPDVLFATLTSNESTITSSSSGGGASTGSSSITAIGSSTDSTGDVSLASGTAAAQCLQVTSVRRGAAVRLLSVPGAAEISPSRPLRVQLVRAARAARSVRYSVGSEALLTTTQHVLSVRPSQLQAGRKTVLHVLLSAPRLKTSSLRVTLSATPCEALLNIKRSSGQLRVTVRRIIGSRSVTLALPAGLAAPDSLILITTTRDRSFGLSAKDRSIRMTPSAGHVRVLRSGHTLQVTGLSSPITGVVLSFRTQRPPAGVFIARVTSVGGAIQSLRAAAS